MRRGKLVQNGPVSDLSPKVECVTKKHLRFIFLVFLFPVLLYVEVLKYKYSFPYLHHNILLLYVHIIIITIDYAHYSRFRPH